MLRPGSQLGGPVPAWDVLGLRLRRCREALVHWWYLSTDARFVEEGAQRRHRPSALLAMSSVTGAWVFSAIWKHEVSSYMLLLPLAQLLVFALVECCPGLHWHSLYVDLVLAVLMVILHAINTWCDEGADPVFVVADGSISLLIWLAGLSYL